MPTTFAIERASGFGGRLSGLLGRRSLPEGVAFCLEPCRSIHTFGMRFTIDLVFLDRQQRIVGLRPAMAPWRISGCRRARCAVELAAGSIAAAGLSVGQLFPFEEHS